MKTTLPPWNLMPLQHIFAVGTEEELRHRESFKAGYIAALRTQFAATEQLEEGWANQAEEVFDITLTLSDEACYQSVDLELEHEKPTTIRARE